MRKISKIFLFASVLFLGAIQIVQAQSKDIITINKRDTLASTGLQKLRLKGLNGMKLQINGSESNQIIYHLKVRGNKNAINGQFGGGEFTFENHDGVGVLFFKDLSVNGGQESNMTWIKALLTKSVHNESIIKDASLTISVPKKLALALDSKYSDVAVSSINGPLEMNGKSGRMNVSEIGSSLSITNNYGDISVTDVKGPVTINGKSSHIDANNVRSDLAINADYSGITINQVTGNVDVSDKSGSVQVQNVSGNFSQSGDYSQLNIADVSKRVEIITKSGSITVNRIRSLNVDADYTNIQAHSITGEKGVEIQGKSANLSFGDVQGPLSINGDYLNIMLSGVNGAVTVHNKNGSINASDLKGNFHGTGSYNHYDLSDFSGKNINIDNSSGTININALKSLNNVNINNVYGDVSLSMKNPFKGHIRLNAQNGQIDSNLDFTGKVMRTQQDGNSVVDGMTGDGKNTMTISAKDGNIRVRVQK